VWQFARDFSAEVGVPGMGGDLSGSLTGDKSRRLSFKGMGAGVARQMLPDGMKALAPSGGAVVDTNVVKLFGYSLSPTGMNEATTSSINRSARLLLISTTYDRAVSAS